MDEARSKEEQFNEAREQHRSLDEKLKLLEAKPYLTVDEEMEIKVIKKKKLHYKDLMESLRKDLDLEKK